MVVWPLGTVVFLLQRRQPEKKAASSLRLRAGSMQQSVRKSPFTVTGWQIRTVRLRPWQTVHLSSVVHRQNILNNEHKFRRDGSPQSPSALNLLPATTLT